MASFHSLSQRFLGGNDEAALHALFKKMDKNGDGNISPAELKQYMREHTGEVIPDAEVDALIEKADLDGCGEIGFEGFRVLMDLQPEPIKELLRGVLAEFSAMVLFQFLGGLPTAGLTGNPALATAFMYATANISGAHLSPAASAALWAGGQVPLKKAVCFIIAEILGAIVGAYLILKSGADKHPSWTHPCTAGKVDLHLHEIFLFEFVATFVLFWVVFATAVDTHGWGNVAPFIIGLTVYAVTVCTADYTGCSMNPARYLGPAIVFGCLDNKVWVYAAAAMLGGPAAAIGYTFFFIQRPSAQLQAGISNFKFVARDNRHMKEAINKTITKRRNAIAASAFS